MSKQWEVKDNGKADAYHPLESMNKWILAYVQSDKHLSANQCKHIVFIVEAVNSHQAMKEALEEVQRWSYTQGFSIREKPMWTKVDKALALANGKGSES